MRVAVIGGGAAGFFSAISVKENFPEAEVDLYEKSNKVLTKVAISGGGRCNVTNDLEDHQKLLEGYPRGKKLLKQAFRHWDNFDTMQWFESQGVPLYAQEDRRVFPKSNSSQSIVDCLQGCSQNLGIRCLLKTPVQHLERKDEHWYLNHENLAYDAVIFCAGGHAQSRHYAVLQDLGLKISPPIPSLFTFNLSKESLVPLPGVVAPQARVKVAQTKLDTQGPVLVTHWGFSGPAVLKLSAFGAKHLHELDYNSTIRVAWSGQWNQEIFLEEWNLWAKENGKKQGKNLRLESIPKRLMDHLMEKAGISTEKKLGDWSKKERNRWTELMCNDSYTLAGKTTFKEEFVTCGGVESGEINPKTLEAKRFPGLFFAGEILDVDGITGGYNFQAAWSTARLASRLGR